MGGIAGLNARAQAWCEEVNSRRHSEIHAIPVQRQVTEVELLGELAVAAAGGRPEADQPEGRQALLHPVRIRRYSVPNRLIGTTVTVLVDERDRVLRVIEPVTGEVHAEHVLVAPGETSIVDAHYDRPRPATPHRGARPRTPAEREFLALGSVAEQFLTGAAAAGVTKLGTEIAEILTLGAAHGTEPLLTALERAVSFGRWRAADVRSILATNGHAPRPTPAGQALVLTLPSVPTRSLDAYRIDTGVDGGGGVVTATTPPPLPADLNDGLKRLKMAAMRRLAPELLVIAKTQRWKPEDFLRTLIEAEIASRDESNVRTRMRQAAFPVVKTLAEFDVAASSIPAATIDYLTSLEWIRRPRTSA